VRGLSPAEIAALRQVCGPSRRYATAAETATALQLEANGRVEFVASDTPGDLRVVMTPAGRLALAICEAVRAGEGVGA
jgi:hypothetical protein